MTREEAKRELLFAKREVMADSYIDKAYDMAIKALEQPERAHGHWTHKGCGCFECDQCGELVSTNVYIAEKASGRFKFCPSCGADMRVGEQDA